MLVAAGLRAAATSAVGIMITIHLVARGLTLAQAGVALTAGLLGNFAGLALLPALTGRVGVVRFQLGLSLVAMLGGVVVAFARAEGAIVPAAMFGMINAVGRDRGPLAAVDQSLLVRPMQALAYLRQQTDGDVFGKSAIALDLLSQRFTLDEFHHQKWRRPRTAIFDRFDDVWMV